ncbi:hypothetical protein [Kribbella sindirgiensis]|uniref:Integrase n=1 Tax=Kribbella sindirgiensis TaxID=1124744 RepID=A0A4R0I3B2_9ACTN|nr:hypothetical protein [Kribbella sindirgiensis]TCC19981.1 hypothetical protein E0H50_37805 [Kribbella sindirgiensis]
MTDLALPGKPGPKLQHAWDSLVDAAREPFRNHLLGGTSADWLAYWLNLAGTPVSASSIRTYRRALQEGV